ncbi:hypothetical protein ACTI_48130 [Actinoplanes sp. OR16]|uniref:hypothetical protein n=1 Tax=Actinoplanes sp. OR16 TaxID=946334 RepID=UPI000F6D9978|nr:hypothetical protein [Actinoplanes sp. OR16]BBH68128.1 hypothetical protein ACTI_48130 [Actinoplanes sp. OR16]
MVSIGTTMIGRGLRRLDMVGGSAIVLTVNAIVFSGIAGVGALFLIFFFADETGTWNRLWPLVTGWAAVTALGAANAYATVRFARRPHESPRVSDGVIALITAVTAGVWLVLPSASPVAVFTAAPFALANVAAAWFLFGAAYAPTPVAEFPAFTPADRAESGVTDISEMSPTHRTPEDLGTAPRGLMIESSGAFRGLRGRAALNSLGGIQLPRRARVKARR